MPLRDLALALLINVLWGFNFVAAKAGVTAMPPIAFTAARFLLIALLLLPWLRLVPGRMPAILGIALVVGLLHYSFIFMGLALAEDITSVAIAVQTNVPFSALLGYLLLGERISRQRLAGIALAFGGVLVIGFDPVVFRNPEALSLVLAGALTMAFGNVLVRRAAGINVFTLNAWIGLVTGPSLALFSWMVEDGQIAAMQAAPMIGWGAVAYSAIAATIIGHSASYYLLRHYPVNVVTTLLLLAPIFGILFAVLVWGDEPTLRMLAGGAITLSGVAVITLAARPR